MTSNSLYEFIQMFVTSLLYDSVVVAITSFLFVACVVAAIATIALFNLSFVGLAYAVLSMIKYELLCYVCDVFVCGN
jgi:hypothetical protein